MKILLVNPWSLKKFNVIVIPNISLGYIAASLIQKGHEVEILDCVRDKIDPAHFHEHIVNKNYDIIGFSLFTTYVGAVRKYSEVVKEYDSSIITVTGGPHAILEPVETLEILENIDYSFRGEAEIGMVKLVKVLETEQCLIRDGLILKEVDNLVWRDLTGKIVCNPRKIIDDLDDLPYPSWEIMTPEKYPLAPVGVFSKCKRVAPIIATRGCPYPCTFCAAGITSGKTMRRRSVENIIAEIKLLVEKFGVKEINILDDNFTLVKELVVEFCNKLIDEDINVIWSCPNGIRLDTLDEKLVQLMERAGCYSFGVGIEFGTQKMLDHTRKCLTLETIKEKISLIKRATDIRVTGFFILGHPHETIEDMQQTIDFSCNLDLDRANFFNFSPFPGIKEYDDLKKEGEIIKDLYDSLYINSVVYTPKGVSRKRLVKLQRQAFQKFYLRPNILFNIFKEINSFSQLWVIFRKSLRLISIPK